MNLTKSKLKQIIQEEIKRNLKEFDTGGRVGQTYEAAERLLWKHAGEIAADPYGFIDTLETAAQIIKDEQRGPVR